MNLLPKFWRSDSIPYGVRVLTFATSVRWIGWGFAECLLPVFMFSFAGTYAATGLLASVYDVALILALPIIGLAADRLRSTSLILVGLVIYLFIGASYFFAGVTGLALFIVLARFLNGVSYGLDSIGRATYIRRHTPSDRLATVFGYFDTWADFWWIVAALAGIFLIRRFPIHGLLLMVTPTSLITFFIIWRFRKSGQEEAAAAREGALKGAYWEMLRELGSWPWTLRLLATFNFFIAFGGAATSFFLPIEAYTQGASFGRIILIGIAPVVPTLFGWILGKWFDRRGAALFIYGFLAFGILLGSLAFSDSYLLKLAVAFAVGIVLELLSLGSSELITVHANPEHFGLVGSVMKTIYDLGSLTGPLAIGILLDWQGAHFSFLLLGALMWILGVLFYLVRDGNLKKSAEPKHKRKYHHRVHQQR